MLPRAAQAIDQERGDDRVTLEKHHLEAGSSEQQRIFAQARRRVDSTQGTLAHLSALDARGTNQQFAIEPPGLEARKHRGQISAHAQPTTLQGHAIRIKASDEIGRIENTLIAERRHADCSAQTLGSILIGTGEHQDANERQGGIRGIRRCRRMGIPLC